MMPAAQIPVGATSPSGALMRRQAVWPVMFAAFVISWLGFFSIHPAELTHVGVGHYRIEVAPERFHEMWFLDALAILASNDAVALGEDAYVPNRLDYLRRPPRVRTGVAPSPPPWAHARPDSGGGA